MGTLTLATLIFMIFIGPSALRNLLKNRNKILKEINS